MAADMDSEEFDALVEDCLEGRLTVEAAARLSTVLEKSAEARSLYWEAASVHGLLEHALQESSAMVLSGRALSLGYLRRVCFSGASGDSGGSLFVRLGRWIPQPWRKLFDRSKGTRIVP